MLFLERFFFQIKNTKIPSIPFLTPLVVNQPAAKKCQRTEFIGKWPEWIGEFRAEKVMDRLYAQFYKAEDTLKEALSFSY